jgi:hypothetical protein
MPVELDEFHADFFQEVVGTADANGRYVEDAFFDVFCSELIEAGDLETADRAHYLPLRNMRVDGYGGDPVTTEGTLSLIVTDFNPSPKVATLTRTDMEASFRRLLAFAARARDSSFRDSLEETSAAFGLADLIAKRWSTIEKVRLFLISNRILSTRVDGREADELDGVPVTYSVWDIGRLHRYAIAAHGREDIELDLEGEFGQALPVLPAHVEGADYEAYLGVLPGTQLAAIYERWGARLLEQNVRTFLQARGGVNKGIRNTIDNHPEMFLAYNNGITATAESIELRPSENGQLLTKMKNFQIVNGGQTTASIHAASRKDTDLSGVFVQMKLSIIAPDRSDEIVPKISEFANTQNRVNAADFFSNHPFHVRMEGFSRRILAPSPDGTFRESRWFYERARGQYQDARGNLTAAARRKFDLEHPKRQMFTKTDLAKFLNVWNQQPHVVSRGAQKNFVDFAESIGKQWDKQPDDFNETFFRHVVAKAIIFRHTEQLVTAQPWYEGGYRANIVAYAIAKVAADAASFDRSVDFNRIWREQRVPDGLDRALEVAAKLANDVITDTDRNVTEWAKQEPCWTRVRETRNEWEDSWRSELTTLSEQTEERREARKDQQLLNGIEAQASVVAAGGHLWKSVREWGIERKLLSPTEAGVLGFAAAIPQNIPTEKQSAVLLKALKRLHEEGCPIGEDVSGT